MRNLAGVENCDTYISKELEKAGITPYNLGKVTFDEVPYTIYGGLGGRPLSNTSQEYMKSNGFSEEFMKGLVSFIFTRAWYYWRVSGYVPLAVAEEMYENPNGVKDIRVAGNCGCPPPSEWLVHHKICGMDVVGSYHIDTQEGLNYFVETLKKHNLL